MTRPRSGGEFTITLGLAILIGILTAILVRALRVILLRD